VGDSDMASHSPAFGKARRFSTARIVHEL